MKPADAPHPPRDRPTSVWPGILWLVLGFLVLMVGYEWLRDLVAQPRGSQIPYHHADRIIGFERSVGLFVEPDVQRAVHAVPGGRFATTWFYTLAYTGGYAAFMLWVYLRRRSRLGFMFTWYWITNYLAVLGYWLFPLAPPRFIAGIGMEDTTKEALELGGSLSWFEPFRNLYAAMPSMHVGQSVLYAIALTLLLRGRWRWLVWLWPAFMLITVMATANHYWMDGVGGSVVVATALVLTCLVWRERPGGTHGA